MIVRHNIKCKTCNKVYTLRIGMGFEKEEFFTFSCEECGEEIKIKLLLMPENAAWKVETISNAEDTKQEGEIFNLDALCPILPENKHRDCYFGRLKFLHEYAKQVDYSILEGAKIIDTTYPITYKEEWEVLRKSWELEYKKPELSKKIMKEFTLYQDLPLDSVNDFIYRFFSKYIGKQFSENYMEMINFVSNALYKNILNSHSFLNEFSHNLFCNHKKLVLDLCKNYFDNFDYFNPIHIHYRVGIVSPYNVTITSNGFNKIKKFYGDAYETLSKIIIFLAFINNLHNNRHYDEFEKLTIKKYKELNNPSKYNCFAKQPPLNYFADGLENDIRNASHHSNIIYNAEDDTVVMGIGKSGEEKRHITYTEYVQNCDYLFCKVMILFLIEVYIYDKYSQNS